MGFVLLSPGFIISLCIHTIIQNFQEKKRNFIFSNLFICYPGKIPPQLSKNSRSGIFSLLRVYKKQNKLFYVVGLELLVEHGPR